MNLCARNTRIFSLLLPVLHLCLPPHPKQTTTATHPLSHFCTVVTLLVMERGKGKRRKGEQSSERGDAQQNDSERRRSTRRKRVQAHQQSGKKHQQKKKRKFIPQKKSNRGHLIVRSKKRESTRDLLLQSVILCVQSCLGLQIIISTAHNTN